MEPSRALLLRGGPLGVCLHAAFHQQQLFGTHCPPWLLPPPPLPAAAVLVAVLVAVVARRRGWLRRRRQPQQVQAQKPGGHLVEIVDSKFWDADLDAPHPGPPLVPGAAPPTLSPLAAAGQHSWQPGGSDVPLSYATAASGGSAASSTSAARAAAAVAAASAAGAAQGSNDTARWAGCASVACRQAQYLSACY